MTHQCMPTVRSIAGMHHRPVKYLFLCQSTMPVRMVVVKMPERKCFVCVLLATTMSNSMVPAGMCSV